MIRGLPKTVLEKFDLVPHVHSGVAVTLYMAFFDNIDNVFFILSVI